MDSTAAIGVPGLLDPTGPTGPAVQDGAIVLRELSSAAELPYRWERQAGAGADSWILAGPRSLIVGETTITPTRPRGGARVNFPNSSAP